MNGDDGYTLTECLVALLIVALAIAGLLSAIRVVAEQGARVEFATNSGVTSQRLQTQMEMLLAGAGPFYSDQGGAVTGDESEFSFACAIAKRCGARIVATARGATFHVLAGDAVDVRLPMERLEFRYRGSVSDSTKWPPERAERQRLLAVQLKRVDASSSAPLAEARLWREQSSSCAFDPIAQDCR